MTGISSYTISVSQLLPLCKYCFCLWGRIQAHQKECNVIRFNPHEPHLFITASSDTTIALWDQRNSAFPMHVLEGHTGAVFSGVWSPFQRNILATSGLDRRVIIWDLNRVIEVVVFELDRGRTNGGRSRRWTCRAFVHSWRPYFESERYRVESECSILSLHWL